MKPTSIFRVVLMLLPLGLMACGGGGGGGAQPPPSQPGPATFSGIVSVLFVTSEDGEPHDLSGVVIVQDTDDNPDAFNHLVPDDSGS